MVAVNFELFCQFKVAAYISGTFKKTKRYDGIFSIAGRLVHE